MEQLNGFLVRFEEENCKIGHRNFAMYKELSTQLHWSKKNMKEFDMLIKASLQLQKRQNFEKKIIRLNESHASCTNKACE